MIKIDDKLKEEIKQYCTLNKLKMGEFVNKLLKEAFTKEKYGDRPPMFVRKEVGTTTTTLPAIKPATPPPPVIEPEPPVKEKKIIETNTTSPTATTVRRRIIKTT